MVSASPGHRQNIDETKKKQVKPCGHGSSKSSHKKLHYMQKQTSLYSCAKLNQMKTNTNLQNF